ncbi:MAG: energy transducer TonB [Saprospirales bacterium]|nr:energy transducer TonB [Saprospirales bacterium]
MPSFQNGTKGLNKFLKENLRYPKEALKMKIEGNIIVRLMIDKDGSVKDPIILKDNLGVGCAEEALRLVQKMPKWWPGKEKGKAVKVYYTLPISFTIPK